MYTPELENLLWTSYFLIWDMPENGYGWRLPAVYNKQYRRFMALTFNGCSR